MRALIRTLLLCALPGVATAHSIGEASRDSGEAFLVGLLMLFAGGYALGLRQVFHASRWGRTDLIRRAALFACGWLIIAASLLSPLHALGARSFTAHMIEHELLMLAAAPLIAWSQPLGIFLWAFPRSARLALGHLGHRRWFSRFWAAASSMLGATLLQTFALWLWHAPAFFNRALLSESWHAAQHLSLVFTALLFWWSMSRAATTQRHGIAAFWLFFTSLQSGLLGALMSFASGPWYARYAELGMSGTGGLTPLEDQQLAGLIMWIPGGAFHAIVALVYLGRWLKVSGPAVATTAASAVLVFAIAPWSPPAHADQVFVSDEQRNRVLAIDGERQTVIAEIPVGARPRGLALSADGRRLYVAVSNDNRIDIVDTRTRTVTGHVPSGPDPEVIALHPDQQHLLAANESDSLVSVIDIPHAKIVANVGVGAEPEGMAISPDGKFAVATSESGGMAHFLRLNSVSAPALIANVLVDTRPRYAQFTADGTQVWVSSEVRGTVTAFDTSTQRKLGSVDFDNSDLEGDSLQAIGIQITRDDRRAFVALGRGNQVAEVDPRTFTIVRAFPAGSRVWNIALSHDEQRLYAAAGLSADLTIIDLHSNRVVGTMQLGGKPWGVVAAP